MPFIMAHMGYRALAPENTMEAFHLAVEHGADVIEIDLRLTLDDVIICMHDITVDRTTDGKGRIDRLTWMEIQDLDVKRSKGDSNPSAKVPSLDMVLDELAHKTTLLLELKAPAFAQPTGAELFLKTLQDHSALDKVVVNSFNRKALILLQETGGPFPVYQVTAVNPIPLSGYPIVGAWWPLIYLNPFYVEICHRRGQIFYPLDVVPEKRLRHYLRIGVDGLITDDPLLTRREAAKALRLQ